MKNALAEMPLPEIPSALPEGFDPFAVEWRPLDELVDYARNAKKITDEDIEKMAGSLKEYGWQQVVLVDPESVIIAGHLRKAGAKRLGWTHAPVRVAHNLTKAQQKSYRLMDNRLGHQVKADYELLALELGELKDMDVDLKLTGFDDHEIQPLLAAEWNPADLGDLDEDKPEKSGSQEKPELKALYFTEEQLEIMEQGLQALRADENDEQITMGRACELWAGSYLSESPSHVAQSNEQDEEEPVYEDEPEQ